MNKTEVISHIISRQADYLKKLENVSKQRYLFERAEKIMKERTFFLGIKGIRGIGKTTLLLQLYERTKDAIYFNADDRELRGFDLYDVIRALSDEGYKTIFIDEIHTKPDWDYDLKTIYDEGDVYLIFSGSSAINLSRGKVDLSRRVILENLLPASFREWLNIKRKKDIDPISLEKLINEKKELLKKYGNLSTLLEDYYKTGGVLYPAKTGFESTIISSMETAAIKDLYSVRDVDPRIEENFFKLLFLVATSGPMELSYEKIGQALGKNKVSAMRFLEEVEKTGIIRRVYPCGRGSKSIRKEAKYYLPFPYRHNIAQHLGKKADQGALREEFFVNHTDPCYLRTSQKKEADFVFQDKIFEVGGKSKKKEQPADFFVTESLAGGERMISLFLMGFLY
jgi:hypothetical protein